MMDVMSLCPGAGFCWLRSIFIKLQKSTTQRPIDRWIPQTHRPQRPKKRPTSPQCIQTHQTPFTKDPFLFGLVFLFWAGRAFYSLWLHLSMTLQDQFICKLHLDLSPFSTIQSDMIWSGKSWKRKSLKKTKVCSFALKIAGEHTVNKLEFQIV